MTRASLVLLVPLVLLGAAAACTSEGGTAREQTGVTAMAGLEAAASYTPQQLERALLTLSDLPGGWMVSTPDPDGTIPGLGLEQAPGAPASGCPELDALLARGGDVLELRPGTSMAAHFQVGPAGPWLTHQVGAWTDGDQAGKTLAELDRALEGCKTITQPVEGGTITLNIAKASVTARGDQTVAYTIDATAGSLRAALGVVSVRRGNLTSTLTWSAAGGPLASDMLDRTAAAADARLDTLEG